MQILARTGASLKRRCARRGLTMIISSQYVTHVINRLLRRKSWKYCVSVMSLLIVAMVVLNLRRNHAPYTGSKYNVHSMFFGEPVLATPSQADIDYIAARLHIKFSVVYNAAGVYYLTNYTFINNGSRTIHPRKWRIYFYSITLIEADSYPYQNGFYIRGCDLKVHHFNGYTYWFEPVGGYFTDLPPGGSQTCLLKAKWVNQARTDSMPRWYATGDNLIPKILASTKHENLSFIAAFQRPEQYGATGSEPIKIASSAARYKLYATRTGGASTHVLPTPLEIIVDDVKTLKWNAKSWVVVKSSQFPDTSRYLADALGVELVLSKPKRMYIYFEKSYVDVEEYDVIPEEAYALNAYTRDQYVHITAGTETGAFYGVQTLLSLLYRTGPPSKDSTFDDIPVFNVKDAPRYSYRGLHIDVARNFQSPGEIKKILDAMAMYKMNKLHLHLTDDEGWRLEIPGMPELTDIGSKRCHDPEEKHCLMSTLGSGPYQNNSGTGYYDTATYKALLKHAKRLHIEIIPEFDMPGHSRAAILSLNSKPTGSYVVVDPDDTEDPHGTTKYMSGQNTWGNAINPCMPETYYFIQKLMEEVKKLHDGIQPLKVFHFGGDEVVHNAWETSVRCKQLIRRNPDLQSHYGKMKYFVTRVSTVAADLGLSLGAWEDGVMSRDDDDRDSPAVPFSRGEFPNKEVYVYVWQYLAEKRMPHRIRLLSNNNYKVVMAYGSYFYFDHPYEIDPEERGLHWAAREVPLRRVWSFSPNDTHDDIDLDCPPSVTNPTDCFQTKRPENIVGLQAELWSETVRKADQADYMLFPRLLAVAERAWRRVQWEEPIVGEDLGPKRAIEYGQFVDLIGRKELHRLDFLGVKYRVSPPGARVLDGVLLFNTEFPGLTVEYFDDHDGAWKTVPRFMPVSRPVKLRTRSSDGRRYSRVVTFDPASRSADSKVKVTVFVWQVLVLTCMRLLNLW